MDKGTCLHTLRRHTDPVYSIAFSPDGKYLASGSFDKWLFVWSVQDGSLIRQYRGSSGIFEVCWDKDRGRVAACLSNKTVSGRREESKAPREGGGTQEYPPLLSRVSSPSHIGNQDELNIMATLVVLRVSITFGDSMALVSSLNKVWIGVIVRGRKGQRTPPTLIYRVVLHARLFADYLTL